MASITYTPTFKHEDWIDNEDVVQAGGDRGFNKTFHELEDEFGEVGKTFQKVDAALASLGQQVAAPVTLGFTPVLLPFGANPTWSAIAWSRISGGQPLGTFVEKPTANDQAFGVLPLSLPHGVKMTHLKVLGEKTGGDVTTELFQELRTAPFSRSVLVTVADLADATTPSTPIPNTPMFDGAANLYYILVRVMNGAGSTVRLRGFQVTYQP